MTLSAAQAVELCDALEAAGVRYWVIGGWGVDALLGRETRPHKDLDILATRADFASLRTMLEREGLTVTHVWKESRWIDDLGEPWPTAFVADDPRGRSLDVHLVGLRRDGTLVQHFENPWRFPDDFAAAGTIGGRTIPCVSTAAQLQMHAGYTLPEDQRAVDLLRNHVDLAPG